jgi:hypothetical protein
MYLLAAARRLRIVGVAVIGSRGRGWCVKADSKVGWDCGVFKLK